MTDEDLLLKAVAQRKTKLVKVLVQGGVDLDNQGYDGKTPLIIACSFVPEEEDRDTETLAVLIKLLLQNGADPNMKDIMGKTAIMYAFRHALSLSVIDELLKNGADPYITDMNGLNAFDFISDKVWSKYRHYMKNSIEYKQRIKKIEENNNEIDFQAQHHTGKQSKRKQRTSLNIFQNTNDIGGRIVNAKLDTLRRTSDTPPALYDIQDKSRRKTQSFSSTHCGSVNHIERMGNLNRSLSNKFHSDDGIERACSKRAQIERVLSDPANGHNHQQKLQHRSSSTVFFKHQSTNTTYKEENDFVMKLPTHCEDSNVDRNFPDDLTTKHRKRSVMKVKVSSIDKAMVEGGIIKTLAKLPPIQ